MHWPFYLLALAIAAFSLFLSPETLARQFSQDSSLAGYVVFRLGVARALGGLLAVLLAAWGSLDAQRRVLWRARWASWSRHPALAAPILAAAAALLWTENHIFESESCAEGFLTVGAWRMAAGDFPYRDFFVFIPPAGLAYLGAAFKLFGPSLEVGRLFVNLIPKLLIVIVLWRLAKPYFSPLTALLLGCFSLMYTSGNGDNAQIYNGALSMLPAFATLPLLDRFARSGNAALLRWAGAAAAAAALVRQDFGALALGANLSFLLWLPDGRKIRPLANYLLPWAGVLAAAGLILLLTVPFDRLYECFVRAPYEYMHYSGIGRPASFHGIYLIPFAGVDLKAISWKALAANAWIYQSKLLLCYIAILGGSWFLLRRKDEARRPSVALLALWCIFFMGIVYKQSSNIYIGVAPAAVILAALLIRRPLPALLLAAHGLTLLFFRPFSAPEGSVWAELAVGRFRFPDPLEGREMIRLITHAQSIVQPSEPVYIHNKERMCSDTLLYFLVSRRPATRYHEFLNAYARKPEIRSQIEAELESRRAPAVIERLLPPDLSETPGVSIAQAKQRDSLDQYILDHYRSVGRYGSYILWQRRR